MDVTTDAIVEAIDQLDAIANGVRVEFLRWIARYDDREGWREDGVMSMADWLTYRRGYSLKYARQVVRIAQALKNLPRIAEAHASGLLSAEKADLLCTIATPDDETEWLDLATGATYAYLEWIVRYRKRVKREETAQKERERFLTKQWDVDGGGLRVNAWLPATDGAILSEALDRMVADDEPDPVTQQFAAVHHRYADALIELAAMRLGDDRANVIVHVDARELNSLNGVASLEQGPPIAAEAARRMSCDGRVQLVASAPDGEPIGVGRAARTVPPWLLRQVRDRDKGCRFLGCGRTRRVQAHHVIHWAHGGRTDLDNIVSLCPYHHRLVHEGGFRLIKDSRGRHRVVRPNGIPMPLRSPPIRPEIRERVFGVARE